MNQKTNPGKNKLSVMALLAGLGAAYGTGHVQAAPLNLADNALEVSNAVEPNVFILTDNSGSMDFEMTIRGTNEGAFFIPDTTSYQSDRRRGYIFPNGVRVLAGYSWGRIVPSEEAIIDYLGGSSDPFGVWRARFSGYNRQYYNPEVTYTPWYGVDNQATPASFTDSDPTDALYNPWLPNGDSEDLTTVLPDYTASSPTSTTNDDPVNVTVRNYYPARYYTWTDTDGDGNVDPTDAHTRIEIKPAASGGSDNYTRNILNESTGYGRSDCGPDSDGDGLVSCSYNKEIQNFANWFTYYRKRDLAAKAAVSLSAGKTSFARVGMAAINNTSSNRIAVAPMNAETSSGAKKALLDTLFNTTPGGGTPLRSNLDKVGRYYVCNDNGDIFGGSAACPRLSGSAGNCQQNYAILMTDGFYNDSWNNSTNYDANTSNDFDGGSFADSYTRTLADIAMHYYKEDLDGNNTNDLVPVTPRDQTYYRGSGTLSGTDTLHQHMGTYTLAYGVEGLLGSMPSDVDAAFSWTDPANGFPEKVDDLRHAAYNGRGLFMNAPNPVALSNSMNDIFRDITAGTGAASAVAFNTQNLKSNSVVFRAFFDTTNNTGDLVALPIDPVTGIVDTTPANMIWSAATQLDSKVGGNSDSRTIITYKDAGASSAGIPFQWTSLTTGGSGQQSQLNSPTVSNYPSARTGPLGKDRLEYLRGQNQYEGGSYDDAEFRVRKASAGKLGDLVHSTPVFVGAPPFNGRGGGAFPTVKPYPQFKTDNKNRNQLVYIGSNDGMLHAFDADDGSEVFAYVPNVLFSNLSSLTRPDYLHKFYVDLTPAIGDVYMTRNSSLDWYTVLVGGLGGGGKGYYALDITDPSTFNTESNAAAHVLWEFTEADDGGVGSSDLGYSFSKPLLAMTNAEDGTTANNKRWAAIFGNGYNSTSTNGNAILYVLFIEEGQDGNWTSGFVKIDTGVGKSTSADGSTPNGLSGVRGVDINLDGTVDYVYAGDLQGNLYRFDLTSTNTSTWQSSTKTLFTAKYGTSFPRGTVQPITNTPIVIKHPSETGFIVVFGTGSWITTDDATSTDIQSIYGVWDDMSNSPLVTMSSTTNQLVEQSFTNQAATEDGFTVRTLSTNTVTWKNTGGAPQKVKGWYIDLDVPEAGGSVVEFPGERAIRKFNLRSGIIFANTVIPKDSTSCGASPGGFTLAFNPVTGSALEDPVFDINRNGSFDLGDNVGDAAGSDKVVAGLRHDFATPADSSFISDVLVTQRSDKSILSVKTNTGNDSNTGRYSWRELTP